MAQEWDVQQWQQELVAAFKNGEEQRARALVSQPGPRRARPLLEAMLRHEDGLVRQAAAFGLGELGGAASARCLERRLALEEARGDHDGQAVADAITQALGRIKEAGARATLVRRLQRLSARPSDPSDVNTVVHALWRKRHPELLPIVRQCLAAFPPPAPLSLHGLLVLLERSPEQLRAWVQDMSVPVEWKRGVLTTLEEEVPEAWLCTLSDFISVAHALLEQATSEDGAAASYCERLFTLLLLHEGRALPALPKASLAMLHEVTRQLLGSSSLSCAMRALNLLQCIGGPEDASLIEAHRPESPILAAAFDETAQALRGLLPT